MDDFATHWQQMTHEMDAALAQWRWEVSDRIDQWERARAGSREDDPGADSVSPEAAVTHGVPNWHDVISGESDDPTVRALHVLLDAQLDEVRHDFAEVSDYAIPSGDVTLEQFDALIAEGSVDGPPRGKGGPL